MTDDLREQLRRAGIKLPDEAKPLIEGWRIVRFIVPCRAVPWTPPRISKNRHAFKSKRLVEWQATVKDHAAIAMAGRPPYVFPVEILFAFTLIQKGNQPDLSNLSKATEDALQGVVIANDRQVHLIRSRLEFADRDQTQVIVFSKGYS